MQFKKSILSLMVVAGIVAAPMTAFAAHTHNWGTDMFYGYEDEQPSSIGWDCVTRHVYNYHQCLTCGAVEVFETETYEMEHSFSNGICVYCGKGYARDAE